MMNKIDPSKITKIEQYRRSNARVKGFKSSKEYEPKQRGIVSMGSDLSKRKGTKLLRDGDLTYEECQDCGYTLRVRKEGQKSFLWCPCGFEIAANELN